MKKKKIKVTEEEKVLAQTTSALDQYWEKLEPIYPAAVMLSQNVPEILNEQQRLLLQQICKLIVWELSARNIRKNRVINCNVKHYGKKYSFVEIPTKSGPIVIETESDLLCENNNKLRVSAYKIDDANNYIIFVKSLNPLPPLVVNGNCITELS